MVKVGVVMDVLTRSIENRSFAERVLCLRMIIIWLNIDGG